MGMSIKDILAAQQRATNATRKYNPPPPMRKLATKPNTQTVRDVLSAQQMAANATRKPTVAPAPNPVQSKTIAEIIEKQRVTAAAQKSATSGINPVLSSNQKAVIDDIRARYNKFIEKLGQELAGQELFMTPPPEQAPKKEEPIFTPNVPENAEVVIEAQEVPAAVNGISVGEEMGGQVSVAVRPKRKRKAKATKTVEPADEEPVAEG